MPSEGQRLNMDVLDRPQAADTRSPAAKRVPAGGRDGPHEPEMDKSELDSWPGEPAAVVTAGTILRWALLLMSLAGVGAAGGFVAADYADEVYAARSEIAFDLRSLDWDSSERFLATQAVIARSRTVLKPIGAALSVDLKETRRSPGGRHHRIQRRGAAAVCQRKRTASPRRRPGVDRPLSR